MHFGSQNFLKLPFQVLDFNLLSSQIFALIFESGAIILALALQFLLTNFEFFEICFVAVNLFKQTVNSSLIILYDFLIVLLDDRGSLDNSFFHLF